MKLTKEVVEKISSIKGEPKWMLDFRLRSLDAFLKSNNPNFGPKIDIDYDNITYYKERENNLTDNWNNISCDVRNIFDDLGVISAEAKYLDGMGAQYDSEVIYHNMNEELKKKNRKAYTVPGMISELENIECTRNSVGKYRRKYALTAKQKLILKQFDMDEKYIDRSIGEFSY